MADRKNGDEVADTPGREVLYPGNFSGVLPNNAPLRRPEFQGNITYMYDVPIAYLSHITHGQEAEKITGPEAYTFLPRQKFGKSDEPGASPWGRTFRRIANDEYERIPKESPVFPGQISWWGISYREQGFQTDVMKPIRDEVGERGVFEVDYLKYPPESRYGKKEFILSWKNIIESYKQSRTDCEKKVVYLKKAGTLRYQFEVCYVVMVIMQKDRDNEEIEAMPSMYNEPRFKHNECIDESGKLVNENISQFHVQSPISWVQGSSFDWEGLAFAFYFPEGEDLSLQCPLEHGRREVVAHPAKFCSRKVCPDNV